MRGNKQLHNSGQVGKSIIIDAPTGRQQKDNVGSIWNLMKVIFKKTRKLIKWKVLL